MWRGGANGGIIGKWFGLHRSRGAVVPFETPALRMARVCDDERDGLIAILCDFANNGTAYVVPWSSLPLMARMTDRDLALHTAVGERKACTPAEVRAVVSELAFSGAFGPEAKAREGERLRSDQSRRADAELVLILHLLESCGADLDSLSMNPARWRQTDAKAAIAAAAAAVGVRRQDIHQRIADLVRLLAPVGLITAQGPILSGWLRTLHEEIQAFADTIGTPSPPGSQDTMPQLAVIAEAAQRTARLSGMVLDMLDYAVLDIRGTVRRWSTELPVLRQAIERLTQVLDEWPSLMKSVNDALRGPRDEVGAQLRVLCSVVPRVPPIEPPTPETGEAAGQVSIVLGARLSAIWSLLRASQSAGPGNTNAGPGRLR